MDAFAPRIGPSSLHEANDASTSAELGPCVHGTVRNQPRVLQLHGMWWSL
jgi:hypothetical protein